MVQHGSAWFSVVQRSGTGNAVFKAI